MSFMNRRTQAQVALIAALVFLLVGAALLAVLGAGLVAGVTGSGALLLGALTIGVFALAVRLLLLARTMRPKPANEQRPVRRNAGAAQPTPATATATAKAPKPRPRPVTRPGTRTR
jgi:membrane protein implicated in regulation of membrane protease activity